MHFLLLISRSVFFLLIPDVVLDPAAVTKSQQTNICLTEECVRTGELMTQKHEQFHSLSRYAWRDYRGLKTFRR